jgi:hypothetical protein
MTPPAAGTVPVAARSLAGRNDRSLERSWVSVLLQLRRAARRRAAAIGTVGVIGFAIAAGAATISGVPVPAVHDEFSYLLAADTFAQGRLTNSTHPFWQHFESFHINQQPTYQSKYPPGQGLVLALGHLVAGEPAVGVWISVGLMAAATAWMLFAWLPPTWALLAAILCAPPIALSYWGQSYWGGAMAATGGALAFGAMRRLWDHPTLWGGAILGGGLGIMALSRPGEGALAGVCIVATLMFRAMRVRQRRLAMLKALVALALVTAPVLGWLGFYNWRVTGSALTMPYQVHEAQYAAAPTYLFQEPGPTPQYRHGEIERYWKEWGVARHLSGRQPAVFLSKTLVTLGTIAAVLMGPALLGLVIPGALRHAWGQFAGAVILLVLCPVLLTKAAHPHYAAPAVPLLYFMAGHGLLRAHRRSTRTHSVNLAIVATASLCIYAPVLVYSSAVADRNPFALARTTMLQQLEAQRYSSLVIVNYGPGHRYLDEWVYNRADIDSAKVVWARSMGAERDRQLAQYFSGRHIWTLTVDEHPVLDAYHP